VLVVPGLFMRRDCAEHRLLAERLSDFADVVTLDVRGHGDSDGSFSGGFREPIDLAALSCELRRTYARVSAVGFSFGGYHVAAAAARYRAFDAVALVAAPSTFRLWDRRFLSGGLVRGIRVALRRHRAARLSFSAFRRRPPDLLRIIEQVAPTPLLIVHGTGDWLVPSTQAQALYLAAAQPKSLLLIEGARHAESVVVDRADLLVAGLAKLLGSER
jgi:pimeloyl-ACP methyl ester carboxylesterase